MKRWNSTGRTVTEPQAVDRMGGRLTSPLQTVMVDIEREAWLISGKHDFPGPMGLPFHVPWKQTTMTVVPACNTPMANCHKVSIVEVSHEKSSGAEAISLVGLYYTLCQLVPNFDSYGAKWITTATPRSGFGISGGTTNVATVDRKVERRKASSSVWYSGSESLITYIQEQGFPENYLRTGAFGHLFFYASQPATLQ